MKIHASAQANKFLTKGNHSQGLCDLVENTEAIKTKYVVTVLDKWFYKIITLSKNAGKLKKYPI